MGTEETITKEVSDEVAATLQDLIDAAEPDEYRSHCPDTLSRRPLFRPAGVAADLRLSGQD